MHEILATVSITLANIFPIVFYNVAIIGEMSREYKNMTSAARCLSVVFVVLMVYTGNVDALHTHVECYPNGTIILDNPLPEVLFYGVAIDSDNQCNLTLSNNNTLVTVTGCSKNDSVVVQLTELEHLSGVIGGAGKVLITVMCQEIEQGHERNITQSLVSNFVVDETVGLNQTFADFSYFRRNLTTAPIASALMSEDLYFTYDLTVGYVMRFLQCTAYPGTDTVTFSGFHKLIENDCTVDETLINSFAPNKTVVVGTSNRYYTEMKMFRFWVSFYITISCDVMICRSESNASCIMGTCDNLRKRRAADVVEDDDVQFKTAMTTFKVLSDPDYILSPFSSSPCALPNNFILLVITVLVTRWIHG